MKGFCYSVLLFISFIIIESCCKAKICDCPPVGPIIFYFNFDPADPKAFSASDLTNFYLVKTSQSGFSKIDSVKISLSDHGMDPHIFYYELSETSWASYQTHYFLISNPSVNFCDTISNLSYTESNYFYECKSCPLRRKDSYECKKMSAISFLLNKQLMTSTDSPYVFTRY